MNKDHPINIENKEYHKGINYKGFMIENKIRNLFIKIGLGEIVSPIETVSGGFLHRMYKARTVGGVYAVKHLNPIIMKRPEAASNYETAEQLESILEEAGIPIVPALRFGNKKIQESGGDFFYIFHWHEGETTDWYHITPDQCLQAGSILGRIHALGSKTGEGEKDGDSHIDWTAYSEKAEKCDPEILELLNENSQLLEYAERELNRARKKLPDIQCISDEDMDPKNIMWENGKPRVIDLECLSFGNPVSHVLQLSLQWSGITICRIDPELIKAFFDGYLKEYDNGFREYDEVFGVAYTWLEWLEYNLKRALGESCDEEERKIGIEQVKETIRRIRTLYEKETEIRAILKRV